VVDRPDRVGDLAGRVPVPHRRRCPLVPLVERPGGTAPPATGAARGADRRGSAPATSRLRRSNPDGPGIRRSRRGRGFAYRHPDGRPVGAADRDRIAALVIPPAWRDVWISPWPNGHIQAVGTDAAGRRQYLYHQRWRAGRDREKHERVLGLAECLPELRGRLAEELAGRGLTRQRVLACAVRLLDLGFFRVGGEEYARDNGTFGLATIRREHVCVQRGRVIFEYLAKGNLERVQSIADPPVRAVVSALLRRRDGSPELLAWWNAAERCWCDVRSEHVNGYVREMTGGQYSAKDFRTWHATVLMAVSLAVSAGATGSARARARAVAQGYREVAHYLGNTPAVARSSYVDPRVVDLYHDGVTVAGALDRLGAGDGPATHGAVEDAVLAMLRG
jgi:DNA topoisomerase I